MLRQYGIQTNMIQRGNCYDSTCAESFYSIIKKELIFHETFTTRKEAKQRIFEYIEYFYLTFRTLPMKIGRIFSSRCRIGPWYTRNARSFHTMDVRIRAII
ncbi:IS3 family transposase [Geobacillus sp. TFV-3]|uniref:IS3 family transposase n=1 Tax=Geobacillus sp. TFV-3 TaxID=1897059 RepID=UPI001356C9CD